MRKSRFTVVAWVVLPDHFHAIIDSPDGDISTIVQRIKLSFALQWRRLTKTDGGIWQHRYWDHIIRSVDDMARHLDYIHFNPMKHRLVDSSRQWELSSFRRFLRAGYYQSDWGEHEMSVDSSDFGE
jgi:putative transposase